VTADAFTVFARSDQSMGDGSGDDRRARARERLLSGEQYAVEKGLWTMLTAATPTAVADADSIPEAIAVAEAQITSRFGGTAVMHLTRYAAQKADYGLRIEGNRSLKTFLGADVVAGGGYGTPPAGANATPSIQDVIATGRMVVMSGNVVDLGDVYDYDTNTHNAVVERTYVVGWDCAAVRVRVAAA
jgi:hypothetical protein